MNLDDLKTRLAEQNAKLDQILRLNATAVREVQLKKTKSSLRWLVMGVVVELALAIVAVAWLGNFIYEHLWEPRFLVPALLIDICGIALIGACIRQLILVGNLNYSLPVVAVQKELGKLRILRIRATKWTMVLPFVLWLPVLIVLFEGLLGVDMWQILWRILGAIGAQNGNFVAWLVGNVLFGLVAALTMIWLWNRYANRVNPPKAIQSLMDDFAGHSLTRALSSLDSIVQFEAEPQGANGASSER